MSNQQTAQDWATVKREAEQDIASITPLLRTATANLKAVNERFNGLSAIENQLRDDPNRVAQYEAARNARREYYNNFVKPAQNEEQVLRDDLNAAQRDFNYASEQLVIASSGAPNTSTNTPPATSGPGNGTTLPQPTVNLVQADNATIEANQDPQSAQDLEFQLQQEQLQAENEGPQPVTGDDAYQDFLADTATEDIEPTYGYSPPQINDDPYPVADLGELGVNTDIPTDAALGELGINTDTSPFGAGSNVRGIQGATDSARAQADLQDATNFGLLEDWRVRLKLAPSANYLYRQPGYKGILEPLIATDGVIFPYTPAISVNYSATYDSTSLTHNNYKVYQYQTSSVDQIQITCDFTAQDTFEANYVLAVIHFFRTVTKMFYGKDQDPKPGTPPPLCYLIGLGNFQFNEHPIVITAFQYNLPTDVDYIRASAPTVAPGVNQGSSGTSKAFRLQGTGVVPGGNTPPAQFQNSTKPTGTIEPTYVPTKIQISISALPIVSRKDISDNFSLKRYATGELLQGGKRTTGGIW